MGKNYTKLIYISFALILIILVGLINRDIIIKTYNSYYLDNIMIEESSLSGNIESNINNYGLVSETNDSIFYTKESDIYKAKQDNLDRTTLINSGGKWGRDSINVVGEWVFFRQGK